MEKTREIIHEMIASSLGNRKKTIRVFLPYDYQESNKSYPVLYMMDGQNLMEPSRYTGYSWNVVPIVDYFQKKGVIDGIIIVGIDADDQFRILEYSQSIAENRIQDFMKKLGVEHAIPEGVEFQDFVVHTVKPFIDLNYRTLPDENGIAGSSCGGNISLYFAVDFPKVFRVIGAFSSAIWIVEKTLIPKLEAFEFPETMKIYQDLGSKEGVGYVKENKFVHRILQKKCPDRSRLMFHLQKGGTHSEVFWQDRFYTFIEWAYKKTV